ncbi:tyrosine-type recombinase/integrase [Colwellia sp. MB02u-14]|uniref:tyrosine-type recombinase/integrase n=1 Tax=Colwellia sp. MB02u-14 TaxID=2759815 RepID=UPI0015F47445|nr:tyrosine-type recombinase/integrase [Colwellia sp. MB02u-14]MBA6303466.1 integrase family protein [Colwellia sp. MB02u-14]
MANKISSLAKIFPQDQVEDFDFSATNTQKFVNTKHPVFAEKVFRDTAQDANGLRIRAYPSGKAVYFVEKRIRSAAGGAKKRIICQVGEKPVAMARKEAGRFIQWMASGKDPYIELKIELEKSRVYTVGDAYKIYMSDRKIKDSTIERYERQKKIISFVHINKKSDWKDIENESQIINTNVYNRNTSNLKSLIDANLNEISSQSILKIHINITNSHGHGDNKAETEGDRVIQFIGHLYDIAREVINERHNENYIKRNPTKIMNQGKGHWNNPGGHSTRRNESLDTKDIKAHYDAIMSLKTLKNTPDLNNKTQKYVNKPIPGAVRAHYFLRFLFWTGWRPGDVATIEWDQIEIEDGITTISWDDRAAKKKLKQGKEIYKIPLNHQAVAVIDELREIKKKKMLAVKNGYEKPTKNYDDEHVFLNVFESKYIKPNQHHYEVIVSKISGIRHYPTGIYRKTFLTYGNGLNINIYTLKRLVFHTQNYFDVTSGYIHTNREVFKETSEEICAYILSFVEPKKYKHTKKTKSLSNIRIDKDIYDELTAQFKDKAESKVSDLIRMMLAVKALHPAIYKTLDSTTTENAKFEDADFE